MPSARSGSWSRSWSLGQEGRKDLRHFWVITMDPPQKQFLLPRMQERDIYIFAILHTSNKIKSTGQQVSAPAPTRVVISRKMKSFNPGGHLKTRLQSNRIASNIQNGTDKKRNNIEHDLCHFTLSLRKIFGESGWQGPEGQKRCLPIGLCVCVCVCCKKS